MAKNVVKFVISEELDIKNHLIGMETYKKKLHSGAGRYEEFYKKMMPLSQEERIAFMRKWLKPFYSGSKKKILNEIKKETEGFWRKIEEEYFERLEKIHGQMFSHEIVTAVLSTARRFGYSTKDHWFALSIRENKYAAVDIVMHELMHFMFHRYFWKDCEKKGLAWQQVWNIKESFTVILNLEFGDLMFGLDEGYPEHKKIRKAIEESWVKNRSFGKALEAACLAVA